MKRAVSIGLGLVVLAGCASSPVPAPVVERRPVSAVNSKDYYTVKKGDTLYSIALEQGHDYRDIVAWNHLENPNRILVGQQLRVTPPTADAPAAQTTVGDSPVAVVAPIGTGPAVEVRPLDEPVRPQAVNTDTVKREPRAGKEPYSDQALAQAQAADAGGGRVETPVAPPPLQAVPPAPKPEPKTDEGKSEPAAETSWSWPAPGKIVGSFVEGSSKGIDIAGKAGDPVLAAAAGKVVYAGSGLRGYGKLVIVKHDGGFLSAYAHNQAILVKEGQLVKQGQRIADMGNSDADQVKLHFEIRREGKPVDPIKYLQRR